jgi:diguanylate cyclase (GGDEF)-like protein
MVKQRKLALALFVAVLGVAAIAAIVALQQRADDSQQAALRLSAVKLELAALQNAPFKATANTGGSPAVARGLLHAGERQITANLRALRDGGPPASLARLHAPLAANDATLRRILEIGVTTGQYGTVADRLAGSASGSEAAAASLLDSAGQTYRARAARARNQATAGAALAIVVLLASQRDALVDSLTGLGNRRALTRDLADRAGDATAARPLLLGLFDLDGFKHYNDTFGHPAGDALLTRLGERLSLGLRGTATVYRMGGDEFCLLSAVGGDTTDETVRRAAASLCESGASFAISCSYGSAHLPAEVETAEQALQLADQRMYAQKVATVSAGRQSSDVLLRVIRERSDSLDEHVGSVAHLSQLLAERLGLPADEQERIHVAAQLHDIGKTAMPDSLLDKRGPLSEEEWGFMRQHTLIGERIVLAAPSLAATGPLIRSSHERVDGCGYPDQLRGDEIPIGARIIAVCDAYDAMISDRVYRAAMPSDEAMRELRRHAGTQFDPSIVRSFVALVGELSPRELARAA